MPLPVRGLTPQGIVAMLVGCGAASHAPSDARVDASRSTVELVDIVASGATTAAIANDGRLAFWGVVPGPLRRELPVEDGRSYSLRPFVDEPEEPAVRFVDSSHACYESRLGTVRCPPWWSEDVGPWPRVRPRGELLSVIGGYLVVSTTDGHYEAHAFTDGSTTVFDLPARPLAMRGNGARIVWTSESGVWLSDWLDSRREYSSIRVLESMQVVGVGAGREISIVERDGTVLTAGDGRPEIRLELPGAPEMFSTLPVESWQAGGCAVLADHSVWCWQYPGPVAGWRCEAERVVPEVEIFEVSGLEAVRVAVGHSHVCAIDLHGAAWCWGANTIGQVGDGSRTCRSRPVRVFP